MIDENYIIYCVYHNEDLVQEYNLVESEHYKLYYTKNNDSNSLNHLQDYFCEFVAMFYVYKNNLQYNYNHIGFEHYRRKWISDTIQYYNGNIYGVFPYGGNLGYFLQQRFGGFLFNDMIEYVKQNYTEDSRIYKIFVTELYTNYNWLSNSIYMCKVEYFNEIIGFLYNFTMYVDKKYNLNCDHDNYKKIIEEQWFPLKHLGTIDFEHEKWLFDPPVNRYRVFAYIYEQILGYYFGYIVNFENI